MPISAWIAIGMGVMLVVGILWWALRFKSPACDDIAEENRPPTMS